MGIRAASCGLAEQDTYACILYIIIVEVFDVYLGKSCIHVHA